MRLTVTPVIAILVILCHLSGWASVHDLPNLLRMPSAELLRKGNEYLYMKNQPDSAMVCFTIAAERYSERLTPEEKRLCFDGWCGRWETSFFGYADFPGALQDFDRIMDIAHESGIRSPKPDWFTGLSVTYNFNYTDDRRLLDEGMVYFRKAFKEAVARKDYDVILKIYDDLLRSASCYDEVMLAEETEVLKKLNLPDHQRKNQALTIQDGLRRIKGNDTIGGMRCFDEAIRTVPRDARNASQLGFLMFLKAYMHLYRNEFVQVDSLCSDALRLTYRYDMKKNRLSVLKLIVSFSEMTGDRDRAMKARLHYVELGDSINKNSALLSLARLRANMEGRAMRSRVDAAESRSRILVWIVASAVAVIVIFGIFLYLLVSANRKLRERNGRLYEESRRKLKDGDWNLPEVIDADDDPEQKDDLLESELESEMKENAEEAVGGGKSASAQISDELRDNLVRQISEILEDGKEVYDENFSLPRLSKLVGSNTRYVSMVINDTFGCGFSTLVNRTRIREACRRLDDHAAYGKWSAEGIGESVGFHSRSAFATAFKKFIGLTPKEYRKISIKKSESSNR